jgi:hypothetical protein
MDSYFMTKVRIELSAAPAAKHIISLGRAQAQRSEEAESKQRSEASIRESHGGPNPHRT